MCIASSAQLRGESLQTILHGTDAEYEVCCRRRRCSRQDVSSDFLHAEQISDVLCTNGKMILSCLVFFRLAVNEVFYA